MSLFRPKQLGSFMSLTGTSVGNKVKGNMWCPANERRKTLPKICSGIERKKGRLRLCSGLDNATSLSTKSSLNFQPWEKVTDAGCWLPKQNFQIESVKYLDVNQVNGKGFEGGNHGNTTPFNSLNGCLGVRVTAWSPPRWMKIQMGQSSWISSQHSFETLWN